MTSAEKVAIVGGGIAGLTAAHRAIRASKEVTLFEPGSLGGLVKSQYIEGFLCECGPNVVLSKPSVNSLLHSLELANDVVRPSVVPYRQYVWFRGKPSVVPKSPPLLLATDLIPWVDKLKLPFRIFQRRCMSESVDDLSVAEFLSKIVGKPAVTQLVGPALRGIFGGDVNRLSARSLFPDLFKMMREGGSLVDYLRSKKGSPRAEVFTLKGGTGSLVSSLQADIESKVARIKREVRAIKSTADGSLSVEDAVGESQSFKEVILAVPAKSTSRLVEGLDAQLASELAEIQSVGLSVLHYSAPADIEIPYRSFGVLFPQVESPFFCGVMFNSVLFPHVAPQGRHLLTVVAGGNGGEEFLRLSEAQRLEQGAEWLRARFGYTNLTPLGSAVWPEAIPQYNLGHYKVIESIERVERALPGLRFIGSYRGGVGIPDRISVSEGIW